MKDRKCASDGYQACAPAFKKKAEQQLQQTVGEAQLALWKLTSPRTSGGRDGWRPRNKREPDGDVLACDRLALLGRALRSGAVAEWSKAHAWKVCIGQKPIVGSNPTRSASSCCSRAKPIASGACRGARLGLQILTDAGWQLIELLFLCGAWSGGWLPHDNRPTIENMTRMARLVPFCLIHLSRRQTIAAFKELQQSARSVDGRPVALPGGTGH